MAATVRSKGVFLYDSPSIEKLKNCCFFWKQIIVFESYLSDVVDDPSLVDLSTILFENDILKIVQTPEGLKDALYDKIYYTLDEDLHQMLLDHPEKYVATPNLPQNYKEIIDESTKLDFNDDSLKTLIDQIVKTNIYNKCFKCFNRNFKRKKSTEMFSRPCCFLRARRSLERSLVLSSMVGVSICTLYF